MIDNIPLNDWLKNIGINNNNIEEYNNIFSNNNYNILLDLLKKIPSNEKLKEIGIKNDDDLIIIQQEIQKLTKGNFYYLFLINYPIQFNSIKLLILIGLFSPYIMKFLQNNSEIDKTIIPSIFQPNNIDKIYDNIIRIQRFLKEFENKKLKKLNETIKITHFDLFQDIDSNLSSYYKETFNNFNSPENRFNNLKSNYKQIIDENNCITNQSSMKAIKVIPTIINKNIKINRTQYLINSCYSNDYWTPKIALEKELIPYINHYKKLSIFINEIQNEGMKVLLF